MQTRRPQENYYQPSISLSQRNSLRLSTLNTQTFRGGPFLSENNSPMAGSFRERLPKFKTQENSPVNKKQESISKFHFPQLIVRQNNPSKFTLQSVNVDQMRSKVAKTTYILDSIIKIFKDEEDLPTKKESKRVPLQDFNQFLEIDKERRLKRPKIIKNQMTRIFLSSQEKERKKKDQDNGCSINSAISQKIGKATLKNAIHHPSRMANEFLPQGKDELNKLRTLRFNKK